MAKQLSDGCISPRAYEDAQAKIVHLLKHGVEEQNPKGYDSLVKMIQDGHHNNPDSLARIWVGCARRAYCILSGFPAWDRIRVLSVCDHLWPAFEKTAVVNMCKELGASSTDPDQMATDFKKYQQEVLQQLFALHPDIVICGGTFDVWAAALRGIHAETSPSGMRYAVVEDTVYLDAYHPSHRLKHNIEYAFFRAGASEICPDYVRKKEIR